MNLSRGKIIMLLSVVALFTTFCDRSSKPDKNESFAAGTIFTCPMHPEVISDKPGTCPICKMHLEPVQNDTLIQAASPAKIVLSRQATVKMSSRSTGDTSRLPGIVSPDLNRSQVVAARFGGRIEKLYVNFNAQKIKKGQKIMDLYSPSLRTIQEEHLFLLKTGSSLVENSREKMRLLGLSDEQIRVLEQSGNVALTVAVLSPYSGYVFFDAKGSAAQETIKNPEGMAGMGMQVEGKKEQNAGGGRLREGVYVNEGEALFSINDLEELWGLVAIPEEMLDRIKEGIQVEILSENTSKKVKGKITFIEQIFEEGQQRFARARVIIPNSDEQIKVNSLITALLPVPGDDGNLLPSSAIYRTGLNNFVWVRTGETAKGTGIFELRSVIAGNNAGGKTQITGGLAASEEVAREAGFMTDSETILQAD